MCGEAENGREAIEKAQQLHPDLIVLDLCGYTGQFRMEKKNGAIIMTREKGGTRETLALPPFCGGSASVLSDFRALALFPIRLK
jgi:DNA-binding NarL/FixJ family response regulator